MVDALVRKFIERAFRVRYSLEAWLVLACCGLPLHVPWVGKPVSMALALLGIALAARLLLHGMRFQFAILGLLFSVSLVAVPFVDREELIRQASSPVAASDPPPAARFPVAAIPRQARSDDFAMSAFLRPVSPPEGSVPPRPAPPVPASPPPVPSAKPEDPFRKALSSVDAWWDSRSEGRADRAVRFHAPLTVVGTERVTRERMRAMLEEDWRANAGVSESMATPLEAEADGPRTKVSHVTRFALPGRKDGRVMRGQCLHEFFLVEGPEMPEIEEHRETVLPVLRGTPRRIGGIEAARLRALAAACLEADSEGDMDTSLDCYGATVSYFGRQLGREGIRADKARHFARWPSRSERFEGEFSATEGPSGVACSFRSRFRTESRERGEWCEGTATHRFTMMETGDVLIVTAQAADVSESRKGILPP